MRSPRLFLLAAVAAGIAAAQPAITNVANAASNLPQGLPNSGIAPGSIFIVQGTNLGPTTLTFAPSAFQSNSLAQTSISIVVTTASGSTVTVSPLMYYAQAAQLAALLPSNTPAGTGSMTVTYQGTASAVFTVTIVPNNIGLFTISQDGQGLAIATYPDYSLVSSIPGTGSLADTCTQAGQACPYTYAGAANPGDVITLWGTGLGAVPGGDGAGSLGQTVSVPMTLWIGGVSVPGISYQGRSGCCVGEDQIIFTMPNNTPTGCSVPVVLQIGVLVSNSALMPIANSGRTCTAQSAGLAGSAAQTIANATGTLNFGVAQLGRQIFTAGSSGTFYDDFAEISFSQISLAYNGQNTQPLVLSSIDTTPAGTCAAYNYALTGNPTLITYNNGLDAGTVTLTSALGPITLANHGGSPDTYGAILSGQGTYFSLGNYTLSGANGKNISSFSTKFTITQTPTWSGTAQNQLLNSTVTRANGLTINWTGGSANYDVVITGSSFTDGTGTIGASFECLVPSTLNTFTVPAQALLALPATPYSEIDFRPALPTQSFSGNGLDIGILSFHYQTSVLGVQFQ